MQLNCRSCGATLKTLFVDLGMTPISNAFRTADMLSEAEIFYPLRSFVCDVCKLVQLQDFEAPESHFHDHYAYFSSFSESWLNHARNFSDMAIRRFHLSEQSFVVEIASNDGYLLKNFAERNIPCLGVDPAANCAAMARERHGVETLVAFFNRAVAAELAGKGRKADVIVANNVLAHVPNLNEFVAAFKILLKPEGIASFEFPHVLELVRHNQFDTIYHEHYSYLSYLALAPVFSRHGLRAFDVERLDTHGGSLRLFVCHAESSVIASAEVASLEREERGAGLDRIGTYRMFGENVQATKRALLSLLIGLKEAGARIAAYGAPAKGNTLLNYCGVRTDMVEFTVDRNPLKQNTYLPGTTIPVLSPEAVRERCPDYLLILAWNLEEEIVAQTNFIREWGGKFILPIPVPRISS